MIEKLSDRVRALVPKDWRPAWGEPPSPMKSIGVVPMAPWQLLRLTDDILRLEIEFYAARSQADDWRKLVGEWQAHIDSIACAIAFDFGAGSSVREIR